MSYELLEDKLYRMPTHFGPSLGPRQGPNGQKFQCRDNPRQKIFTARFSASPEKLSALLPPDFSLAAPVLNIEMTMLTEIEWLAGRGYNALGVSAPVQYNGEADRLQGNFLFVLWENMADPVITGREDLGFSKLYCELPAPQIVGERTKFRAVWDGCEFATLDFVNRAEIDVEDIPVSDSDGTMHYKYVPKTFRPGLADAAYPVLTPSAVPNMKIGRAFRFERAEALFRNSTWEELPTLVHIVNSIAELEIGECLSAHMIEARGAKDVSDQRPLR